jgi:hypothetical protein
MSYPKGLVIVALFVFLIFLSALPAVLQWAESSLPRHMIIEHSMFFILGSASVVFAEIILRCMVTMSFRNNQDFSIKSNDKGPLLTRY